MTTKAFATSTTLSSGARAGNEGLLRQLFASTPLAVFVLALRASAR
jgi:hypothetical protein